MKIGIVSPYSFDYPGGVMRHVLDLSKTLIVNGHQVKVLAPGHASKNQPAYVTTVGWTVPIPTNGSVARIKFGPAASEAVQNWLNENDFDILHIHEPTVPSVSIIALYYATCPVVATFHAFYKESAVAKIFGISIKRILKKISIAIAVSENAKQTAQESYHLNPIVIPNGITVTNYAPSSKTTRKPNTILFLGRVDEKRKGLKLLLKSLKYIIKTIPDFQLIIAGSGTLPTGLAADIEKYSDHIKVVGEISETEKHKLLQTSAVYIAPQLFGESFGIVLLEAFAAQIPVIASAIPAFIDLSGRPEQQVLKLFAVEDKKHLARKIIEVFKNDNTQITKNAHTYARQFDWKVVAKQIEDVYKSLVK